MPPPSAPPDASRQPDLRSDADGTVVGANDRPAAPLASRDRDTEQRLAELEAVYDAAPVGLCVLDTDLRFVRLNRRFAEINGVPVEGHIGRTPAEVVPDLGDQAVAAMRRVLETGEMVELEVSGPTPAQPGIVRHWDERWKPIFDGAGEIIGISISAEEVTERKAAEAALREANARLEERVQERTAEFEDANVRLQAGIAERTRAEQALRELAESLQRSNEDLERFAYVASHDLQEPLRSIVSFSQLLERRFRGQIGDDADEYIDFIVEGGTRMQGLILDLLTFSRVNTTRQQITRTDVEDVFAEAVRALDVSLREAGATLTHDPLPAVMADPVQLLQVFSNLISNAVKFRKPDVPLRVHVGVCRADGFCEFSVSDNGIGIEPEYFDRIFVIFQRLHTKETYPGTGIGLAIVKRIIDRHGGTIRVESTPGEGTTFYFTLPAA